MVARILATDLATFLVMAMFGCGHQYNPERGKDCRGCDLTSADLSRGNLTDAYLLGANLKGFTALTSMVLKTLTLNI